MRVGGIAECSRRSILRWFLPTLGYLLSLASLFCLFWVAVVRRFSCASWQFPLCFVARWSCWVYWPLSLFRSMPLAPVLRFEGVSFMPLSAGMRRFGATTFGATMGVPCSSGAVVALERSLEVWHFFFGTGAWGFINCCATCWTHFGGIISARLFSVLRWLQRVFYTDQHEILLPSHKFFRVKTSMTYDAYRK